MYYRNCSFENFLSLAVLISVYGNIELSYRHLNLVKRCPFLCLENPVLECPCTIYKAYFTKRKSNEAYYVYESWLTLFKNFIIY